MGMEKNVGEASLRSIASIGHDIRHRQIYLCEMASENGELVNKSVVGLKYADFALFDNMPGMRMLYVLLPTRRLISFRHIAVERV